VFLVIAGAVSCRSSPIDTASAATDAVSEKVDAVKDSAPDLDPQKICQSSDECVLVHWGCCPQDCSPLFTVAVNRDSEARVHRIEGCGVVCAIPMPCGYTLSASCDQGACALHCAGACPALTSGDASVFEATLGETTVTHD
jgi:hypothetical protein